jgi:protein involved in plasmid replication-relaxation
MRLTRRCMELLQLLRAARWLTTGQVHRRFFPGATKDAARKRLRKLTGSRLLVMVQEHRMQEALFTIGPEGKRALELSGAEGLVLERRAPKQREHFLAINDLRIAAEQAGSLSYFFASWELAAINWRQPIIPDAVFALGQRTFAAEVDLGHENIGYIVKTKVPAYRRGFDGLPLTAILILTDRIARMRSLARAIADEHGKFVFSTIDLVREHGLRARVFYRGANGQPMALL